ncbi:MMPL family transporter [Virgibacillus sp. LDC-1]|uniref:MMPL family transporter n=1 Tax=Virgibacillus sp. LDC-1 TaxID=3039856 RepID=UPI0024DE6E7E|nr:MMPL family transporter [Virgibacillus sp. LDC-1]
MKNRISKWGGIVAGARSRWMTIFIWVLLVAIFSFVWPQVNDRETKSNQLLPEDAMSVEASKLTEEQFSDDAGTPLLLVWYRDGGLDTADYEQIQQVYGELVENPLAYQAMIPPFHKLPPQALQQEASSDGEALTTPIFFEPDTATELLEDDLERLKKVISNSVGEEVFDKDLEKSGLHVRLTGPIGIQTDAVSLFSQADVTLLIATVLLVLVLLVVLYRSPILALVPLIAVGVAYGLISPLLGLLADKGWIEVDAQAISIMTVLLFGAGTDYCLFLISRYREELRTEADKYVALRKAVSGTGGAIMISAMTTVMGLLTLGLAYYASYDRFAVPFSLSIFIMGIAALTLLPAILALLGRFAFFPFIPRTEAMIQNLEEKKGKKLKRPKSQSRFYRVIGRWVTEKPWTIIITCVVVLGGLGLFVPKMQYTYGLLESFPEDMPSREGFTVISEHYPPGEIAPAQVIVQTDGQEIALKEKLSALSIVENVSDPTKGSKDPSLQEWSVTLAVDPYSTEAIAAVPKLQEIAENSLKDAGVKEVNSKVWIGGETATLYDTEEVTSRDQSIIIPVVLLIIALLLVVYLRSIVAMVYLLATVVLSYLAALGLGWIIIHYGLGATAMQGLIPVYAFVFLVALGEDYNIFMVSSIWKKRRSMPLKQAIAEGVGETGTVISSAGLILAGTFSVLAMLPLQVLVQFGLVTAIGVLLDTFVVRPLLVPAITTVLGRYAFWPGKLWKLKDKERQEEVQ